MNTLDKTLLEHVTSTSHLHDVKTSKPVEMSNTLRMSYLMTLPFFNTVAFLTNILIFCIFSTGKMKKYRASVFFCYVALVDAANSCVMFGLMWLALAAPETKRPPVENYLHCRMYTVFRYTLQDLSAYGLVCLLMERCSAMSATRSFRPTCLLLTVCRLQWVVRHLSCKVFLLTMSLLALIINMGIVFTAPHELEQPFFTDCFNTWKSPLDFTYESLAMNHALLSMIIPAMSCVVGYLSLRVLLSRHHSPNGLRPMRQEDPRYTDPLSQRAGCRRASCGESTHTRWIHLDVNPPTNRPPSLPPRLVTRVSGEDTLPPARPTTTTSAPAPTLTMMSVDEAPSPEDGNLRSSCFLDRLYAMIKSREFVLSIVCVGDSRLTCLPPPDLTQELNAMASISALFFVLLVQPQLLVLTTGCILRSSYHSALDWSLLKNVGLAADLIFNNRISFTLFLYLFVSGKRMSSGLMQFLHHLVSCCYSCTLLCRRCPHAAGNPRPEGRVRFSFPGRCTVQARGEVTNILVRAPEGRVRTGGGPGCCPACAERGGGGGGGGGGERGEGEGQAASGQVEVVPKMSIMTPC